MKKFLILLLLTIFLSGCTRIDNEKEYKNIANNVINSSTSLVNTATRGYKYYLPKGVSLIYNIDFNQKFRILEEDIYMYVDIVSYYYKKDLNDYEKDFNYYFSNISSKNKVGYIGINKENDEYFVKLVYNYAKVEFYTNEDKLSNLISYSMIIMNSIEYNDILILEIIEDNNVRSEDSLYKIKKPEDSESKFNEYLEEYVQDEEKIEALPDE